MDTRKEELDLHNSECHPTETTQADMQEENQELKRMVQKLKGDVTKAAQQEANARALAEKANEGKVKAAAKVKLAQTGERSAKLALEREKKNGRRAHPQNAKRHSPVNQVREMQINPPKLKAWPSKQTRTLASGRGP